MKKLGHLLSYRPFKRGGKEGTDRRHPAATLSNANLLQNLQQTVFQTDLLGTLRYLSPGWLRITGYDPKACLRTGFLEYIHPADRKIYRKYFERILLRAQETSLQATMRLIRNDGSLCWVAMQANPISESNGTDNPRVRGVVGTLNDITMRMQSEDLRDARHRSLQNLVDNLCGVVFRYRNDRDRTMEYISGGCRELLGYAPRDLINNRKLSYTDLIHEGDQQMVWDQIQTAIHHSQPFSVTYRVHTAEGKLRKVREWGRGLTSESGVLLSVEGFIADFDLLKDD